MTFCIQMCWPKNDKFFKLVVFYCNTGSCVAMKNIYTCTHVYIKTTSLKKLYSCIAMKNDKFKKQNFLYCNEKTTSLKNNTGTHRVFLQYRNS